MRVVATLLVLFGVATPAAAQSPVNARPFVLVTAQRMAAAVSFDAVTGSAVQPFWGAGGDVVIAQRFYVDITISRFRSTGERAFRADNQTFQLGIPLTVTLTPIEIAAGIKFRPQSALSPYAGGGAGHYAYAEESPLADPGENVDTSHVGYLVQGGVEGRVRSWLAVTGDVQFTRVSGILGTGGVSAEAGESDLGGVAARVRVLFSFSR